MLTIKRAATRTGRREEEIHDAVTNGELWAYRSGGPSLLLRLDPVEVDAWAARKDRT